MKDHDETLLAMCRDYQMSNLSVRLIVRTRVMGILFFAATVAVYYYVKLNSCLSWVAAELGYLPLHIVMTALIIIMLYLFMPKDPDEQDAILQVLLCHFHLLRGEFLEFCSATLMLLLMVSSLQVCMFLAVKS